MGGKDDVIDVKSFLGIVRDTVSVLDHISSEPVKWVVGKASRNTPLEIEIEGDKSPIFSFIDSVNILQSENRRPEILNDAALKRLISITRPLINGMESIVYSTENRDPLHISLELAASIEKVKRPAHYFAYTELEGELGEVYAHRNKFVFCIFDPITNDPTTCKFDPDEAETIGSLITHRLKVWGNTKYTRTHKPIEITVDKWEEIKNPVSLDELHDAGFKVTTDEKSEELIRKLRDLDA